MPISTVFNEDCTPALQGYPDHFWDVGLLDVPYGIDASNMKLGEGKNSRWSGPKPYKRGDWDKTAPGPEYWQQLFRVTKHQVIFGANHFISLIAPHVDIDASCWVVWDKNNGDTSFADAELAWTSFETPVRLLKYTWSGYIQELMGDRKEERIHPTQKPTYLYRWLLEKFCDPGWKVLDTHMGSQSSRIAAHKMGFDYWGWEIDTDYFNQGTKRYLEQTCQQTLF